MLSTDIIRLAAVGLWRRRLRAGLTIIGVVIGTVCIIIMIALGLSNMEQFNKNFMEQSDLTQIQVYSSGKGGGSGQITQNAIDGFKRIDGVKAASGSLDMPMYVKIGNYESDLYVSAVDKGILGKLKFKEGKLFTSSSMPEFVIGNEILKQFHEEGKMPDYSEDMKAPDIDWLGSKLNILFGQKPMEETYSRMPASPISDESTAGGTGAAETPKSKQYKGVIAGLIDSPQYSEYSYKCYMDISVARNIINQNRKIAKDMGIDGNKFYNAIVVVNDIESSGDVVKQIQEQGYEAYSPAESIETFKKEQARQQSQLLLIAAISLLVSAIGIANTMLTSILERKTQIGIMKVVGLKISKIRSIFLAESALIGLSGGIIGSLISYLLAALLSSGSGESFIFGMYFGEGVQMHIPLWLALAATGIAIAVGIISGIYPAYKATKMSPLEAIRATG